MKILSVIALFLISFLLFSGCISFSKDSPNKTIKSNFEQDAQGKIVIRELANPIADVSTFNLIVQSVITDNPFSCVGYTSDGNNHAPIEKIKEVYTARILYKDNNANIVSTSEETFNSSADYKSGVAAILANTQLAISQGGIAIHDSKFDIYSATLTCHNVNGENYNIVFTRDDVILAGYSDDSIRTKFETWANTVASLTPVKEKTKEKNTGYLGNIPIL